MFFLRYIYINIIFLYAIIFQATKLLPLSWNTCNRLSTRTDKELFKSSCFSSFLYRGIIQKSINQCFAGTYDGKSDSADHTIHHNVLPPKFSIASTKRSLITLFTDVHIYSREYFDLKPMEFILLYFREIFSKYECLFVVFSCQCK